MASTSPFLIFLLVTLTTISARPLTGTAASISTTNNEMQFQYHRGPILAGNLTVNLLFYGSFTPAQRSIVSDFIISLSSNNHHAAVVVPSPSVSSWWSSLSKLYPSPMTARPTSLSLGSQSLDTSYSAGKSLSVPQLQQLAAGKGNSVNSINIILTSSDVAVDGFCMNRCGTHGSFSVPVKSATRRGVGRAAFIWVGNAEAQCPGMCAWPFHQPIYGPQGPPLVAPNGDVGMDGLVINLAGLLVGTVTNPFGNGYYQGPKDAPLEAASACAGVYGRGAYPGYAGELLVDPTSGASYNANGAHGRKYLVPGLFDPATSTCSTLV